MCQRCFSLRHSFLFCVPTKVDAVGRICVLVGVMMLMMSLSACGQKGALYLPAQTTQGDKTKRHNETKQHNDAMQGDDAGSILDLPS